MIYWNEWGMVTIGTRRGGYGRLLPILQCNIIVADAFFSKATFIQGLDTLGFELVSRFRDNVRLRYLYAGEKTGKKGRPQKFDGNVDLTNLKEKVFTTETYDWDGVEVTIHSAVVYAVSLKRNVKVVLLVNY